MSKQRLEMARGLIREKRYDEARAILKTVEHPTATAWLKKLDELAPKTTGAPVPVSQAASDEASAAPYPDRGDRSGSAILGVAVCLVAVAAAAAIFLYFRGSGSPVEFAPLAAVEVADATGCGAQAWWNQVRGRFGQMTFNARLGVSDMDFARVASDIRTSREVFAGTSYPDCVGEARAELLAGVDVMAAALEGFDPYTPSAAMIGVHEALLKYQHGAQLLQGLGVTFDSNVDRDMRALVSDCPAELWLVENLFVRNDFFRLTEAMEAVIYASDPATAIQNYVFDLSGQALSLKYVPTPPCLTTAKAHVVEAMEAFVRVVQAYTGHDGNGMLLHIETMEEALRAFAGEVARLGVDIYVGV